MDVRQPSAYSKGNVPSPCTPYHRGGTQHAGKPSAYSEGNVPSPRTPYHRGGTQHAAPPQTHTLSNHGALPSTLLVTMALFPLPSQDK